MTRFEATVPVPSAGCSPESPHTIVDTIKCEISEPDFRSYSCPCPWTVIGTADPFITPDVVVDVASPSLALALAAAPDSPWSE